MNTNKSKSIVVGISAFLIPFALLWYLNNKNKKVLLKNTDTDTNQHNEIKPVILSKDRENLLEKAKVRITILYATSTGTARIFSRKLEQMLRTSCDADIDVVDMHDFNDDHLEKSKILLLICSTWEDGKIPVNAQRFYDHLVDYAYDFRVGGSYLSHINFSMFGLGGAIYGENFGKCIREMNENLLRLGAEVLLPTSLGDDASDLENKFSLWSKDVVRVIQTKLILSSQKSKDNNFPNILTAPKDFIKLSKNQQKKLILKNKKLSNNLPDGKIWKEKSLSAASTTDVDVVSSPKDSCCGGAEKKSNNDNHSSCCNSNNNITSKSVNSDVIVNAEDGVTSLDQFIEEDEDDDEEEEDRINNNYVTMDLEQDIGSDVEEGGCGTGSTATMDLEDLGGQMLKMKQAATLPAVEGGREMVTRLQRKALTKEGYRIIGSHSAVKLCRWTKNQMRGRGGCYKHTFYGITSYQCMEATPSLACANKCVFCWRHHKNPVGTEWRWKTDEPDFIVDEAISQHRSMINQMRGVPGVLPERLIEGNTVRHCALSLVGEPIMYPRINEMLQQLHVKGISSFLVTNAQFPECIDRLDPVTQLYVSVDAPTRDSLKAIDRPLFKDFWERYLASLTAMREKKQRSVYRMTLVQGWNMTDLEQYAELVELGRPDFIEIKAVTYCGKSDASSLTMDNVPRHADVCAYAERVCAVIDQRGVAASYAIATEHEHSCCILLARTDKYLIDGAWHTWIDYDKFNQLIEKYYASGKTELFNSSDYLARTPDWALYQSSQRGFDPIENRWRRNKTKGIVEEREYKSSEIGCGRKIDSD